MAINTFTVNGVSSDSMHIIITKPPAYPVPERDVERVSVPGRNGDVIIDHGAYKNITVSYEVAVLPPSGATLEQCIASIRTWLCGAVGYAVLRDTYSSGSFYHASYTGAAKFESIAGKIAKGTLTFDCKPFKYLDSGNSLIQLTSGAVINNPGSFFSQPVFRIVGSGQATITIVNSGGTFRYTINNIAPETVLYIDSEQMIAYHGSVLDNGKLSFSSFPTLVPGNNTISWTSGITSVYATPRWRSI